MEHLLRHWTNGRFGWGRRVVKIHFGEAGWRAEAIEGDGDSAKSRSWAPPTEEDALQLADELMSDADGWRGVQNRAKRPLMAPWHAKIIISLWRVYRAPTRSAAARRRVPGVMYLIGTS